MGWEGWAKRCRFPASNSCRLIGRSIVGGHFRQIYNVAAVAVSKGGHQTNMMVFGSGGYRFSDYLKIGIAMNLLMLLVASALIPFIWPF
ncbi:MAG: hypothetical protein JRJ20_07315 [Deltaproteobacteria bacterium]|nr:hypothetical protein [Deltaproteobacteria bacterium]